MNKEIPPPIMDAKAEGYRRNAAEVRAALLGFEFTLQQARVVDGVLQGSLDLGRGRAVFLSHDELGDLIGMERPHVSTALERLEGLRVVECKDCLYMVLLPVERWHVSRRVDQKAWMELRKRLAARDPEAAYKSGAPVAARDLFGLGDELNEELRRLVVPGNESRQAGRDNGSLTSGTGPAGSLGTESVHGGNHALATGQAGEADLSPGPAGQRAARTESVLSSPFPCTDSVRRGEGREGRLSVSVPVVALKRSTLNAAERASTESVRTSVAGPKCQGMALPEDELMRECSELFGRADMASSGGHWRKVARMMAEELTEGLATLKDRRRTGTVIRNPPAWVISWLARNYREKYAEVRV